MKTETKTTETKKAGAVGAAPDQEKILDTQDNNIILTPDCQDTYEIDGKSFPVKGKAKLGDDYVPIVDVPMMSDITWQLHCLGSRIRHPEEYRLLDAKKGGTIRVMCNIISWIKEHREQATEIEWLWYQALRVKFEESLKEYF